MIIETLLQEHRKDIVAKWFDRVARTYPPDTAQFLRRQPDPFANPVGATTHEGLETTFSLLLTKDPDREALRKAVDPIVRIRAVQTILAPAIAVEFPYYLKTIIREMFQRELTEIDTIRALMAFERKIDELALIVFEVYTQCRETVHHLRATQEKNGIYRAFRRAGLVEEIAGSPPESLQ